MKENLMLCELCQTGPLLPASEVRTFTYKGQSRPYTSHFSECDCCGIISKTPEQDKACLRAINSIKKSIDGLLSGDEIQRILSSYHLTQTKAAELFGGGRNAFSKYIHNDVVQAKSIDNWLRVVDLESGIILHLAKINNVKLNEKIIAAAKGNKEATPADRIQSYAEGIMINYSHTRTANSLYQNILNVREANKLSIKKINPDYRAHIFTHIDINTAHLDEHMDRMLHFTKATDVEGNEVNFTEVTHTKSIMPLAKCS